MEALVPVNRIGVLVRPNLPEALPVLQQMSDWLNERDIEVLVDQSLDRTLRHVRHVELEEMASQVDIIVVFGGDGSMLGAARLIGTRPVPVMGINFGRLGYLTDFTLEELFPALEYVVSGHFTTDPRLRLEASVYREGELLSTDLVLNDVVINRSASRMIEVDCWIDSQFVTRFHADGLIVATPTGSTAYTLSAGGPIIYPGANVLVLTPICPHTLSNRPLVITDTSVVELALHPTHEEVTLMLDGQRNIPMRSDDRVIIRKSASLLELVRPPSRNYYQVLRSKLRWGGQ